MRFQVPQFTEVEDKIVGPLTLKQFIYLAGAGGMCLVIYVYVPKFIAFPLIVPVALFGVALAFYKVHNRPFIRVVESFLYFTVMSKLYIWKHEPRKPEAVSKGRKNIYVPKLNESRLGDLTWSLEVKRDLNEEPPSAVKPDLPKKPGLMTMQADFERERERPISSENS